MASVCTAGPKLDLGCLTAWKPEGAVLKSTSIFLVTVLCRVTQHLSQGTECLNFKLWFTNIAFYSDYTCKQSGNCTLRWTILGISEISEYLMKLKEKLASSI